MATSTTVLLTGSNTGLGFEIAKSLCASSHQYTLIMAGRSLDKVSAAITELQQICPTTKSNMLPLALDVESDQSISDAAAYVAKSHAQLDVLINNAGASFDQGIGEGEGKLTVRQAFGKDWDVNVTGTHLLTIAMAPHLLKSGRARLIFMTSGTSSLTESESDAWYFNKSPPAGWPKPPGIVGYRSCKAGLNMLMRDWHRQLKNDGVLVWSVSPGFLATGLGGNAQRLKEMGALDPSVGGEFVKDVVEGKRDADAGKAIRKDMVQPW